MALTAVHPAMHVEEPKNVHPFFSKTCKAQDAEPVPHEVDANQDDLQNDEDDDAHETGAKASKPRKKRTKRAIHSKNQPSLDSFARRPAAVSMEAETTNAEELAEPSLDEDPNLYRRKRRKTTSPPPTTTAAVAEPSSDLYHQLEAEAALTGTQEVIDKVMVDTLVADTPRGEALESSPPIVGEIAHGSTVPESSLPQAGEVLSRSITPPNSSNCAADTGNENVPLEVAETTTAKVTPKKQIKVTKTGKLVSSPPQKPDLLASATPKRRGRPRKAAKNNNLSSTITIIRYGSDDASRVATGCKINAILGGGNPVKKQVSIVATKPAGPPKAPHPFFAGKAGQKKVETSTKPEAERRPVTPRKSACTPGKLRAERRKEQDDEDMPAFGVAFKNSRQAKHSGLSEPSWPSKETTHVRNLDYKIVDQTTQRPTTNLKLRPAKLKNSAYTLSAEEEIITRLADQLSVEVTKKADSNNMDFAPPEDVRLPTRQLTTGLDIQHKVRAQIRAPIETLAQRLYAKTHPAITTLFDEIEHTLTPFDEGRCEPQAWAQKYRPCRADHVLQTGREAFTLRDWLRNLTVMSVGAAQELPKTGAPLDTKKPHRKKRKTAADDFIVFSDEEDEDEEMVELDPSNDHGWCQNPSLRRSRWTRNKNVVLLSGPHGCGKSASVYAVAKELDFEVFELHAGVRRSGKDIQDKVGDMTANHLVNHQRGDLPAKVKHVLVAADNDTDNEREKAFQKDLDSGRQGTMTSFFTARPVAKSKPTPMVQVTPKSPTRTRTIPAAQAMLPIAGASRKSQKQSLILIEEADILFEEDQNFWPHIIKLAAQSKRPIVITCNNELHVPTQALPMAAILRLGPPPVHLATDYLIALAGREGHILQRQAVSDLYISKNRDLRASITELNFWCQMSVGDKKGGLEWMYQRWPPGKDVDANGRLLRVASEHTYQSGMGWLSHNVFETSSNVGFDREEELLTEVWHDWGISPTSWTAAEHQSKFKSDDSERASQSSALETLDCLVTSSDALSASDIYSCVDLPTYETMYDQPMDPTLPPTTSKERLSYTIDAPLLQVDPLTDFLNLDVSLAAQTHILSQNLCPGFAHGPADASIRTDSLETSYMSRILHHKTLPTPQPLLRTAFSSALDVLATPPSIFNTYPESIDYRSSYNLIASSLDRPFPLITLDIAPYVRSIVAHEQALESMRIRLGNLLSEGGRAKRGRTTRASRTAMEGGERGSKRRERWFHKDLNFELVMRTAGSSWAGMGWKGEGPEEGSMTDTGSVTGTQQSESVAGTQKSCEDVEVLVDAEPN